MARFRPRKTFKLLAHLRGEIRGSLPVWKREEWGLSPDLEHRCTTLHRHCADQSSQLRLTRLVRRLTHHDFGVRESALAELELATRLIRTGASVKFLPESQARTADLECHLDRERFFIEVTAMVGSAQRQRLPLRGLTIGKVWEDEEDRSVVLIHRILARIRQKATQLAAYSDPVVLSISIPRADLQGEETGQKNPVRLDLKILTGTVTVLLTELRHLSAVMISLWDVEPVPSKAGTRLANVELIERARQQQLYPRARMLVQNPAACKPLSERQEEAVFRLL